MLKRGRTLTCTVPGNVPGRSCAGLWADGTGTGQETAPRQLHRGPAAQRKPPINNTVTLLFPPEIHRIYCDKVRNLTEAAVECSFSTISLAFLGNTQKWSKALTYTSPPREAPSLLFHLLTYNREEAGLG